jgi:hypothetical protein
MHRAVFTDIDSSWQDRNPSTHAPQGFTGAPPNPPVMGSQER